MGGGGAGNDGPLSPTGTPPVTPPVGSGLLTVVSGMVCGDGGTSIDGAGGAALDPETVWIVPFGIVGAAEELGMLGTVSGVEMCAVGPEAGASSNFMGAGGADTVGGCGADGATVRSEASVEVGTELM
jgi:hypothetical protein